MDNINQQLLQAVQTKNLSKVSTLLSRGACPFQKAQLDASGNNILMVAIDNHVDNHSLEIINALIKKKPVKSLYLTNFNTETPLMLAAKKGLDDVVKLFIAKSGTKAAKLRRLDLMNIEGWNAFALACLNHHWGTMKILAEAGVVTNNSNLMLHSVQHCDVDLVMTLAQDYQYNFRTLPQAVTLNQIQYVKLPFLMEGIQLAVESSDKKLLAMFMGLYNKTELTPDLIQNTCSYAIQMNRDNIVQLLTPYLSNNINSVVQPFGLTLAGLAVKLNRPGALIKLIRAGASCKMLVCSSRIKAVLSIAGTQENSIDLISLLVSDISTTGNITAKVLNDAFIAAIKMRSDICALYLLQEGIAQKGFSLEYVNEKGENGIALAGQYNCVDTINRCFGMATKNQMMMVDLRAFFEQALLNAARCGSLEAAKFLIYIMNLAECMDANGNTPIILASENGHGSIVIELIKAEAYLNKCNKFDQNALILAIENSHELIAMMLLKARVNALYVNSEGQTLLMAAAKKGLLYVTEILVKEYGLQTYATCKKGLNALMYASIEGHTQIVNCLINAETNIGQQDFNHKTAFDHAYENKKAPVLLLLIRAGAKFDFQNEDIHFILKKSSEFFKDNIISLLIDALFVPGKVQLKSLNDAFMAAVSCNLSELIKPFIRLGAKLDYQISGGTTPISLCTEHDNLNSFELLLENGASTDVMEENSVTLMYAAAQKGNLLMVKRLIEINPGLVDMLCSSGHPPVYTAAQFDHVEIVRLLLTEGKSSHLKKTVHGDTLLHFSASSGSYKTVKMLLEFKPDSNSSYSFDVNMKNQHGLTGLMSAVIVDSQNRNQDNLVRVTEVFIQKECNLYLEFGGKSALDLALDYNNTCVAVRILCEYPLEKIQHQLNNPQNKIFVEDFINNIKDTQDQMLKVLGSMWVDDKEKPAPFLSLPMELRAKIISYNDYAPWYAHRAESDIRLAIEKIYKMIENRRAERKDTPPAVVFLMSTEAIVDKKNKERGLLAYKNSIRNMDDENDNPPAVIFSSRYSVVSPNKRKREEDHSYNESVKTRRLLEHHSSDDESGNETEFSKLEKSKTLKTVYLG